MLYCLRKPLNSPQRWMTHKTLEQAGFLDARGHSHAEARVSGGPVATATAIAVATLAVWLTC